jgi:predicted ATPase
LDSVARRARHSSCASIVADAVAYGHALSLCYVLVEGAIPLALETRELALAGRLVALLLDQAARHGFAIWRAWGACAQEVLLIGAGDAIKGAERLRAAIDALRVTGFAAHLTTFLCILAKGLRQAGELADALAAIDEALALCARNGEGWCLAELLRVRGELAASRGDAAAAEADFRRALDEARRQGALTWELRAAASLARIWHGQRRTAEARELLAAAYDRFTEGFETAELTATKRLLDELGQPAA